MEDKYTEEDIRFAILQAFTIGIERPVYSQEIEDKIINLITKSNNWITFVVNNTK